MAKTLASVQAVSPEVLSSAQSPARLIGDAITRALVDAERLADTEDMDVLWDSLRIDADFERRLHALRFRLHVEAEPRPVTPTSMFRAVALALHESRKRRDG
jgi:hypothetical protein